MSSLAHIDAQTMDYKDMMQSNFVFVERGGVVTEDAFTQDILWYWMSVLFIAMLRSSRPKQ